MDKQELIDLTGDEVDDPASPNLTRLSSRLESVEIDAIKSETRNGSLTRSRNLISGVPVSNPGTSFYTRDPKSQRSSNTVTPEPSGTPKRKADSTRDFRSHSRDQSFDVSRSDRKDSKALTPTISLSSPPSSDSDIEILRVDRTAKRQKRDQTQDNAPITVTDSDSEEEQQAGLQERDDSTHRNRVPGAQQPTALPPTPHATQTVVIDEEYEGEDLDDNEPFSVLPSLQIRDDDVQIIRTVDRKDGLASSAFTEIDDFREREKGFRCARGKCVELTDNTFVRITSVIEDKDSKIWIVGPLFRRHNDFDDAKWPRRHNEVVLIRKVLLGEPVEATRRPLSDILRNRQLILTNEAFKSVSSRTHPDAFNDPDYDKQHGPLFCRWKQTQVIGENARVIEECIERLAFADADENYRKEDSRARKSWRGSTTKGQKGSVTGIGREHVYTFGDAFCGGGGASCGAREAGLRIKYGVDLDKRAMQTYALNFEPTGTDCQSVNIFDFLDETVDETRYVDILHMSPPCQPYSPAHTTGNLERDEMNQAALFSVGELLKKAKPRVATLEETFGLFSRHKEWFDALIKMFLDNDYSVRWTVAHLEKWGLPQKRRRLLILGAGRGDSIPHFPDATHSETDTTLRPLATIRSAISQIPPEAPNHDLEIANFGFLQRRPAYSAFTQAKTVTCSGGQGNHHPSGLRAFTIRELACLQCFPIFYKFADLGVTDLRRQIGNAVPPFVFKRIYREIKEGLKKTDGRA